MIASSGVSGQQNSQGNLSRQFRIQAQLIEAMRKADRMVVAGDYLAAALEYARLGVGGPDSWLPKVLCSVAWMAASQPEKALFVLESMHTKDDRDVLVALLMHGALSEIGRSDDAHELWLHTTRLCGDRSGNLDVRRPKSRLLQLRTSFPNSPMLHGLLGDVLQVARETGAAETAYRRAITLAPRWSRPRVNLGIALTVQGRVSEAVAILEDGLRVDPGNVRARLAYGDAQVLSRKPEKALQAFKTVVADPRFGARARLGAGRANVALGRDTEAAELFDGARQMAPKDPAPYVGLAEIHSRRKDHRAAAESYGDALRLAEEGGLFSARPSLLRSLVEARIAAGDSDIALGVLARARRELTTELPLWWRLEARVRQQMGDTDGCFHALRLALESETQLVPATTLREIAKTGLADRMLAHYVALRAGDAPENPMTTRHGAMRAGMEPGTTPAPSSLPLPRSAPSDTQLAPAELAGNATTRAANTSEPIVAPGTSRPAGGVSARAPARIAAVPAIEARANSHRDPNPEGRSVTNPPRAAIKPPTQNKLSRIGILGALGHLYHWKGDAASEIDVRREIVSMRPSGVEWYRLAVALERGGRWNEARGAWKNALKRGGLGESDVEKARRRLNALGG